jgi:hypothetical protein
VNAIDWIPQPVLPWENTTSGTGWPHARLGAASTATRPEKVAL